MATLTIGSIVLTYDSSGTATRAGDRTIHTFKLIPRGTTENQLFTLRALDLLEDRSYLMTSSESSIGTFMGRLIREYGDDQLTSGLSFEVLAITTPGGLTVGDTTFVSHDF